MNDRESFIKPVESILSISDEKKYSDGEDIFLQFIFHQDLQEKHFASSFKSQLECNGVTVSNPDMRVTIHFPLKEEFHAFIEKYQHLDKKTCYKKLIKHIETPFVFYIHELSKTHELPESAILLLKSIPFIYSTMDFSKNIFFKELLHKLLVNLRDSYQNYLAFRIAEINYTPLSSVENKTILSLIDLTPTKAAFEMASYYGTGEIMKRFLKNGFDVNELFDSNRTYRPSHVTPLMNAAREDKIEVMQVLLEHKAKIDSKDSDGKTALMYAALYSKFNAAKLLIDSKADTTIKDRGGSTASDLSFYDAELRKMLKNLEPKTTLCCNIL